MIIKRGKFERPRRFDPEERDMTILEEETMQIPIPPEFAFSARENREGQSHESLDDDSIFNHDNHKEGSPVRPAMKVTMILGGLVLVLLTVIFVGGMVLKSGNTIYPNVYVAGVSVGGMTAAEAETAVEAAASASYEASVLEVRLPDRTIVLHPDQTNAALDEKEAVEAAMAYGRRGNPFSAVSSYWVATKRDYEVPMRSGQKLDTNYIRQTLEQLAAEVKLDPCDPEISFDKRTETLTIVVGSPDRELDTDALYTEVCRALLDGEFAPLEWEYREIPCEPVDLMPYYEKYCTEAEDAVYDKETGKITEEVVGYGFDLEDTMELLEEAEPGSTVEIKFGELIPEVTRVELEGEFFGVKLFTKSTPYVKNENRTNNLRLSCEAINGIVLNPGDVFSFNEVVGERTADKGYRLATVYSGGESLPELGGGVCQVASTLYYVTLHMDLEQVERKEHMFTVGYVDLGMDATIYWGSLDYKFKNNLDQPIKIQANVDNGTCNITFWGHKPLEKRVEMAYTVLSTVPWEEVEELDETKPAGFREEKCTPYTGHRVVTNKTVYDLEGNKLTSGVEAYSTYQKRDHIYIVGPAETPEDPLSPDDWIDPDEDENDNLNPWF